MNKKIIQVKIVKTEFDRRRKLTDKQKEEIYNEYWSTKGTPNRTTYDKLGAKYGVSKHLIKYICKPEKLEVAKVQFSQRQKEGRYRPTKEKRSEIHQEHYTYKENLVKMGKISI